MIFTNLKMALASIRSAKVRSLLTMLGVIIGVMSVVMTVSIGEGVKNQVLGQLQGLGNNVVSIRSGREQHGALSQLGSVSLGGQVTTSTLSDADVTAIKSLSGIVAVAPEAAISVPIASTDKPSYDGGTVIATTLDTEQVLNQPVEYGEFFEPQDLTKNVAVIGSTIANDLFGQRDPVGRTISINGQPFIIRGILSTAAENPLNIGPNVNTVVYIPMASAKQITAANLQISQISVKLASGQQLQAVSRSISDTLFTNHHNQKDFTVITQTEYIAFANQLFTLLTSFVAAVAAISLFVGGIGIMNIMLVSVSERTREIGVRKAIGASNQQILGQFLIEAVTLSVLGGILGVVLSLLLSFIIRITTSVHPSISFETILLATGVSCIVGIVFGMAPAIQAARKDPIEALRHE